MTDPEEFVTNSGPEFDRPPVEEVALSVAFEPLQGVSTRLLSELWALWRDELPVWEDAPSAPTSGPGWADRHTLFAYEHHSDAAPSGMV